MVDDLVRVPVVVPAFVPVVVDMVDVAELSVVVLGIAPVAPAFVPTDAPVRVPAGPDIVLSIDEPVWLPTVGWLVELAASFGAVIVSEDGPIVGSSDPPLTDGLGPTWAMA
ncbi:hypothetical protein [Sphingomonas profundi]|uniref:hypothetical protein n=1 Tax=Alterirhizorhabdus profundi TaxID=2681549 RepID=UPI0012E80F70|nr:hypothetical protein [Sphingomonas profundi]